MHYLTLKKRHRVAVRAVFSVAISLQLLGVVVGQEAPSSFKRHLITFAFEEQDALIFPVTIDGVSGPFVIDSAATLHVLDRRFNAILGEPTTNVKVGTSGSPVTLPLFRSPELVVRGIKLKSEGLVATHDMKQMSMALGRDVHGVLGAPFFLSYLVNLDFDRERIHILGLDEPPQRSWGVALPLRVDEGGHAYVKGAVSGAAKIEFVIDTGMNGAVSLARREFQTLQSQGLITSLRKSQFTTASGHVEKQSGSLATFTVGPFKHASVDVTESTANKIGLRYLSRFRVTIDMPRHHLYLARGDAYARTDDTDKSGLRLLWQNNRVVVDLVDDHSPAQRAGILKGDVVLDVNGTPAKGTTLSRVRQQFRGKEGEEQRLATLRGKRNVISTFSLQEYGDWIRHKTNPER